MKLLQINSFYEHYLRDFYRARPALRGASCAEQMKALLEDGFSASHVLAPHLAAHGYETDFTVANAWQVQARWALERGMDPPRAFRDVMAIVGRRIELFRPDVLYVMDPITFDSRFLRALSWKPALVVGWRAAVVPPDADLGGYDLILSSDDHFSQRAREQGARAVEFFRPGFAPWIADAVAGQPKRWDVVFSGQISDDHATRLRRLTAVAKAPLSWGGEFTVAYRLLCHDRDALPAAVHMHDHGPAWGLDMHRFLRSGRIALNVHGDGTKQVGQNMRIVETVGSGSFLLTEESPELRRLFEPGREIDTYRNGYELLEKVRHYLAHPEEREAMAARAQERCLREHGMARRAEEFHALVRRYLPRRHASDARERLNREGPAGPQSESRADRNAAAPVHRTAAFRSAERPAGPVPRGVIAVAGMRPGEGGAGLLLAGFLDRARAHGLDVVSLDARTLGADLVGAALAAHERTGYPVLLLHPQLIGMERALDVVERLPVPSWLYLFDAGFFCVRSSNHRSGTAEPCLACIGGAFGNADRFDCLPSPVPDRFAGSFVTRLETLVRDGRVRLLAQNRRQAELAERHFQRGAVPTVGMWTDEFEGAAALFDQPPVAVPDDDAAVVFHGVEVPAKGARWAIEVARHAPRLRFVFPFHLPVACDPPPNALFRPMTWHTGLRDAVAGARLVMVPSLWSAPIESALVKSILYGGAVAVVDNPTAFADELPDGLVLRLPPDPAAAAAVLVRQKEAGWSPDPETRKAWLSRFRAENRDMVGAMLDAMAATGA